MSGLGEMGNLLKQAQELQRQLDRLKNELKTKGVVGSAGGGVVKVELSGDRREVRHVEVAAELLKNADPTLLAELVQAAVQDALSRAGDLERESIGRVTGGLQLPGFF
jgi:hypothetical protein